MTKELQNITHGIQLTGTHLLLLGGWWPDSAVTFLPATGRSLWTTPKRRDWGGRWYT